MNKVFISEIVNSGISEIITGLTWIGAPTSAVATFNKGLSVQSTIGVSALDRLWIQNPESLEISISTIIGNSNVLNVGSTLNLNTYIASLVNDEGIIFPQENQAILNSISINFVAGQVMVGNFSYIIHKPNKNLMEWFNVYSSTNAIPTGTGEQLFPILTEECGVYIDNRFIEGVYQCNIQTNFNFQQINTKYKRYGIFPILPLSVNIDMSVYNDYVVDNENLFTNINGIIELRLWKIKMLKPRLINMNQPNNTGSFRNWNISMIAKNLIKE